MPCCVCHGSRQKVSRSGCKYMSDSSMRTKPSMDEPSNMHSLSSAFRAWLLVMATFLSVPKISVNCKRINLTSFSSRIRRMSSLVYLAICLRPPKKKITRGRVGRIESEASLLSQQHTSNMRFHSIIFLFWCQSFLQPVSLFRFVHKNRQMWKQKSVSFQTFCNKKYFSCKK